MTVIFKTKDGNFGVTTSADFERFIKEKGCCRRYSLVNLDGKIIKTKYHMNLDKVLSWDNIENWFDLGDPISFLENKAKGIWGLLDKKKEGNANE